MQATYRRNTELSLLVFALVVACGALAIVAATRNLDRLTEAAPVMIVLAICYLIAHIVTRRFAPQADALILPLVAILNGLGVTAIYRLDSEGL
jgi:hypothetical protein